MSETRIAVVGGGPGGYVAAIRAAQLGAKVTLIEKEQLGGTCLNVGCIPTKALLDSAHAFEAAKNGAEIGVIAEPTLDWGKVQARREAVVKRLVSGVKGLLRANGVQTVFGTASFADANTLEIVGADGKTTRCGAGRFILASGSIPAMPPIPGIQNEFCIDSTAALTLREIPARLIVIGGGVIGVELATAYGAFGAHVEIVELTDGILPGMDRELAARLQADMEARGITFHLGTKADSFGKDDAGAYCLIEKDGKRQKLYGERILVCIGRKANVEGLALEKAGVKAERAIVVNEYLQTMNPNVYAIGDCNGKQMLAHSASEQGMTAAENCMGARKTFDCSVCPAGVYATPELACVGMTEEKLGALGIEYNKGTFPTAANGRALILRQDGGMVKILSGKQYGEILGVHILSPNATELIAEAALAMRLEATVDELIETIHAHPTVSECLHEAALATEGRAIHIPNRAGK